MDLPASLNPIRPYLQHAKQVGNFEPLIAYYCRYYAIQKGMEILGKQSTPETKTAVIGLLEKLEGDKKTLADKLKDPQFKGPYVIEFANKIFDKANTDDREGNATKATALSFYASSIFYEILKQFGELEEEIQERQKYAKWKATDISSAIKSGKKPIPGSAHRPEEVPPPQLSAFPSVPEEKDGKDTTTPNTDENQTPKEEQEKEVKKDSTDKEEEEEEEPEEELIPLTYTMEPYDTMGCTPEAIDDAHKYARYAVSALQFEDRPNAVLNLTLALNCLGVQLPSQ